MPHTGCTASHAVTTRMTRTRITDAVCHTYTAAGVQLVPTDAIHRRNPRTTTGAQTADLLKDLTERLPATFVHARHQRHRHPLFSETRGARLAGRATLVDCGPLPARHGPREPFRDVITDIKNALALQQHKPGPPARPLPPPALRRPRRNPHPPHPPGSHHRHHRHHRSITKTALDAVHLDHLAEQHRRPTRTVGHTCLTLCDTAVAVSIHPRTSRPDKPGIGMAQFIQRKAAFYPATVSPCLL